VGGGISVGIEVGVGGSVLVADGRGVNVGLKVATGSGLAVGEPQPRLTTESISNARNSCVCFIRCCPHLKLRILSQSTGDPDDLTSTPQEGQCHCRGMVRTAVREAEYTTGTDPVQSVSGARDNAGIGQADGRETFEELLMPG
jgi:hypothetical protein